MTKRVRPPAGLKISVVAVYPFGFRWDEPAYRSFEMSQRLIDASLERLGERLLFFGPSEFKVYRPEDDNVWAATDAINLLPPLSLPPSRAAVLRPWAEKRVHRTQAEMLDKKGKGGGVQVVEETTYVGHVELLYPETRETFAELSAQVQVDPFADHSDDVDPSPELTALMLKLVDEAATVLAAYAEPVGQPKPMRWKVTFVPKEAFEFTFGGRPAFDALLSRLDAVEADLLTTNRVRFANPHLSDAQAARAKKLPGGLLVDDAPGSTKVQAGDLITSIDGRPALRQSLARARLSTSGVLLKVRRAAGQFEEVPWP